MDEPTKACPLCQLALRREELTDESLFIIDCGRCGIFQISNTSRLALLGGLRNERFVLTFISRVKPANAEGFVLAFPSEALIAGHPWTPKASR